MAKRVLLIDDEEDMVEMVSLSLSTGGYDAISATDPKTGLKKAASEKPDLILLDVMMPGTDGYEICKILKKQEETKNIPIIFFTAMGDPDMTNKVADCGGIDYITKPFEPEEMLKKIRKAIDNVL